MSAAPVPELKKIIIHTDGGCHGNPGPGGWAAVLQYGSVRKEISGGCPATTNNRMELQAAIEALRCLKQPCAIEFWTDSEYVKDGITLWVAAWKRKRWRTKERKPVRNADLWQELDRLIGPHQIFWHWLKGHAGHVENERCDILAQLEIEKIRKACSREALAKELEQFSARRAAAEQAILADKPPDPQPRFF